MERPDLSTLTPEQLEYVCHLEGSLTGASDLIVELNLISKVIASEVASIRLSGNILDDDKSFAKVMALIEKVTKIKSMSEKPPKKEKEFIEEKITEKEAESADSYFEQAQKRVREKANGRTS